MSTIKLVAEVAPGVTHFLNEVSLHHIPRIGETILVGSLLGLGDEVGLEVSSVMHPVQHKSPYIHVPIVSLKLGWRDSEIIHAIKNQWQKTEPSVKKSDDTSIDS